MRCGSDGQKTLARVFGPCWPHRPDSIFMVKPPPAAGGIKKFHRVGRRGTNCEVGFGRVVGDGAKRWMGFRDVRLLVEGKMSRKMCLAVLIGGLLAAPGCSCMGGSGGGCNRTPSFMEFRSPCGCGNSSPAAAPACAPACEPACAPAAAPCCEQGGQMMSLPVSGESGTFS